MSDDEFIDIEIAATVAAVTEHAKAVVVGDLVVKDVKNPKAAIEVTRIVGPHLSGARILNHDPKRPIAKGDFVYTPLWKPGRIEKYSFVGFIDFDCGVDPGIAARLDGRGIVFPIRPLGRRLLAHQLFEIAKGR